MNVLSDVMLNNLKLISTIWSMLWFLFGISAALLFVVSIKWSVYFLRPEMRKTSNAIIFVGFFIRWILVSVLLFVAVQNNIIFAITFLLGFLLSRNIFLFRMANRT